jgi:beta-lactamase superfamily II metal-dependent hydrolase
MLTPSDPAVTVRHVLNTAVIVFAARAASLTADDTLDIYFIDVEGGQATLIVTPVRQSLLVDTGWDGNGGRDARRIVAAVRDAGLNHLDYLLTTNFHPDHYGGLIELAAQVPVRTFIDHGGFEPGAASRSAAEIAAYEAYVKVRAKGQHIEPSPAIGCPSMAST